MIKANTDERNGIFMKYIADMQERYRKIQEYEQERSGRVMFDECEFMGLRRVKKRNIINYERNGRMGVYNLTV